MRVSYWLHEIFASLIPRPTTATLPLLPRLIVNLVGSVFLSAVRARQHWATPKQVSEVIRACAIRRAFQRTAGN